VTLGWRGNVYLTHAKNILHVKKIYQILDMSNLFGGGGGGYIFQVKIFFL
jgi:hypothetical protein